MGEGPSVGRIVHYRVSEHDSDAIRHNGAQVLPAVIVRVWNENCVNLRVLCDGRVDAWKTSVVLGDQPSNWSWPARS